LETDELKGDVERRRGGVRKEDRGLAAVRTLIVEVRIRRGGRTGEHPQTVRTGTGKKAAMAEPVVEYLDPLDADVDGL